MRRNRAEGLWPPKGTTAAEHSEPPQHAAAAGGGLQGLPLEARRRCAQTIKNQITITLHISNFVIVARLLYNYALTIYSSVKLGAIAHVGIRPFTEIGALVAVYHGLVFYRQLSDVFFKIVQCVAHLHNGCVHLSDAVVVFLTTVFIVPMKVGIRGIIKAFHLGQKGCFKLA